MITKLLNMIVIYQNEEGKKKELFSLLGNVKTEKPQL